MTVVTVKDFSEMTLAALRRERDTWDRIITNRKGWDSAYQDALDCRLGCEAMIARREREAMGDRTAMPHGQWLPESAFAPLRRDESNLAESA